jgi:hypothetical protein
MSVDITATLIGMATICLVAATIALIVWRAIKRR